MKASTDELKVIRSVIEDRYGFSYDEHTLPRLERAIEYRMAGTHSPDLATYLKLLFQREDPEGERLAQELIIGETYFFRHVEQLNALVEKVIPTQLQKKAKGEPLRVISAGCSTGEEPYSLLMLLWEKYGEFWKLDVPIEIIAMDLSPQAIESAQRARYSSWSLRQTPTALRSRHFIRRGNYWELKPDLKKIVRFKTGNLLETGRGIWSPGSLDVILCRNVLIYFSSESKKEAIRRFHAALKSGGALFLSHAETLRGLSDSFELKRAKDVFFYHKCDGPTESKRRQSAPPRMKQRPAPEPSWCAAIEDSCRAITKLVRNAESREDVESISAEKTDELIGDLLALMKSEYFEKARARLMTAPSFQRTLTEVLLVESALALVMNHLSEAERLSKQILVHDDLNACAYYILAQCKENSGNIAEALEFDRRAIYLDATFAMPHLQLGFIRKRAGDRHGAGVEFRLAEALLQNEDETRLILFSGGLSRSALISLCVRFQKECAVDV